MKRSTIIQTLILILAIILFNGCSNKQQSDYTRFVDPFIGTDVYSKTGAMGNINLFPGPTLPHGMVQLSPDTDTKNIGGYQPRDSTILGFSHTHPSGTGCYGLGHILAMPVTGNVDANEEKYRSPFERSSEKASVGYYKVKLLKYNVLAELTTTRRAGMHKYTYLSSEKPGILIDVTHNLAGKDTPTHADVSIVDDHIVEGSVTMPNPFCGGQSPYTVYFTAITSKPFKEAKTWKNNSIQSSTRVTKGKNIGVILSFDAEKNQKILMKVGISYVSKKQAKLNVTTEIPHWDFNKIKNQARQTWNEKLSLIKVEGGRREDKIKFYTSLYHSFIGPYTASDVNGKYRGMDNKVYTSLDHTQYHFFSLWDTFRAVHPLFILTQPKEQSEMVQSLLNKQKTGGWLPKWEFANRYTNCMIADHAISVIAETYMKGIRDFDVEHAYKAMKKNSMRLPRDGQVSILSKDNHFIPLQVGNGDQAKVIWNRDDTLSFNWKWQFNDNRWHHYVLTYNSNENLTIYMDNKMVGQTKSAPMELASLDMPWVFGKQAGNSLSSQYFSGKIDELAIYNGVLSKNKIKNIYSGQSINGNLVTKITFDSPDEKAYQTEDDPIFEDGKKGKSLVFDGINDILKVNSNHSGNSFTISFWIKTSLPSDYGGRKGLDYYMKLGYIPFDVEWGGWGSVSSTLEGAYNDYALAQVANEMEKIQDYQYFKKRARNYQNLFDKNTFFMRPKKQDGSWKTPFNPESWEGFTEGNSWSYTWFVPHDIEGLVKLLGKKRFIKRLDYVFEKFIYPAWDAPFSHYWHGNEPSQQVPYLYNYIGQPWKTQEITRKIMNKLYDTTAAGIPGNEDVGQLSAWYVFSAMGFYPVAPVQGTYALGSPLFNKVTIQLDEKYYNGSKFTITSENNSPKNKYIQSFTVNNEQSDKNWFHHTVIKEGGCIHFKMGSKPDKKWGSSAESIPPSIK